MRAITRMTEERMAGVLALGARMLADRQHSPQRRFNDLLWYLASQLSDTVGAALCDLNGPRVRSGPFAGMTMLRAVADGSYTAKLLGCYERELHGLIRRLVRTRYRTVVNVGCAEGYYAVGLARRMPAATVHAHDTDPEARRLCRRLARANGLGTRRLRV